MLETVAPYATIITAIVAAYMSYVRQLRLRAFEYLLERRLSILNDVEGPFGHPV